MVQKYHHRRFLDTGLSAKFALRETASFFEKPKDCEMPGMNARAVEGRDHLLT
jgi:hypothetical protein